MDPVVENGIAIIYTVNLKLTLFLIKNYQLIKNEMANK